MSVHRIEGRIRTYVWGSRTALAELTGRPVPTAHPEAELWFGAHPGAPCDLVDTGETLEQRITEDPVGQLGHAAGANRLPFLLKLLAAARNPGSVTVRIGEENEDEQMRSTSVVSIGYGSDKVLLGGMGVVGPTRMDYPGTIAAVRAVATYVGRILSGK